MARVAIATVSTASAMNCPGSSAWLFHAGMEMTTTAQASCATVKAEINSRISGQNGWYDQHNRGTYSGTADAAQRVTGDGKYTDKMTFTLTGSGDTCQIEACSESQGTSYADFGTNYCNLKLLVCGSDQGCNVANSDFSLGSETTKAKAGASVDMSACLKVSELKATDTCTLYQISDDGATCGESSLSCAYTGPAKIAEPGLKDGNCADQGYTIQKNSETKSYPFVGDITITEYGKAAVQVSDTCTLYQISDDGATCGESSLSCAYTGPAKLAEPGLKDGNCADQGYTIQKNSETKSYPFVGDITITEYGKAAVQVSDTCTLYQISDDGATCGESSLSCAFTGPAKLAEPGLKDGNCADQGYTLQQNTETKSYPFVGDITITVYGRAAVQVSDTCTLYQISDDGATCGESSLSCAYTGPAKLAEPGLKDGNCADQGYTLQQNTETKSYPFVGDITITVYGKASVLV